MASSKNRPRIVDSRLRLAFAVEMARGASHIASTLGVGSRAAAIHEVFTQFIADRGHHSLEDFRLCLADALERRGCRLEAADVKAYVIPGFDFGPTGDDAEPQSQ
jgi:hypothetical protein